MTYIFVCSLNIPKTVSFSTDLIKIKIDDAFFIVISYSSEIEQKLFSELYTNTNIPSI